MSDQSEKRRHPRLEIDRPAKVFRPMTNAYAVARTMNVSAGGALLEIKADRPIGAGETIDLGVAWTSEPVLTTKSMVHARVIRAEADDTGGQVLAVIFEPQSVAA